MATVNFSVPEEVKAQFNATFKGHNKSAIITRLMVRAIEEAELARHRAAAVDRVLARRDKKPYVSSALVRRTRLVGRP